MESSKVKGIGRELTARYLASRGLEVIATGWTCASGSIDIIARDCDALVFATVAANEGVRESTGPIAPPERARLESIALAFASRYDAWGMPVRFDEVSVFLADEDHALIRHLIDAGSAPSL